MREKNLAKIHKTKAAKERRLMRKLKEMEKKRLKDNMDTYHYEIENNNIIKVEGGL